MDMSNQPPVNLLSAQVMIPENQGRLIGHIIYASINLFRRNLMQKIWIGISDPMTIRLLSYHPHYQLVAMFSDHPTSCQLPRTASRARGCYHELWNISFNI